MLNTVAVIIMYESLPKGPYWISIPTSTEYTTSSSERRAPDLCSRISLMDLRLVSTSE